MDYQGGHPLTANNGGGHLILVTSSFARWRFSAHDAEGRSGCAGNHFVVVHMQQKNYPAVSLAVK